MTPSEIMNENARRYVEAGLFHEIAVAERNAVADPLVRLRMGPTPTAPRSLALRLRSSTAAIPHPNG